MREKIESIFGKNRIIDVFTDRGQNNHRRGEDNQPRKKQMEIELVSENTSVFPVLNET